MALVVLSAIAAAPVDAQTLGTAAHNSCECNSLTLSKPVASGTDRTLLVSVAMIAGSETLNSVTYDGNPMTEIGSAQNSGNARIYLFERKLGSGVTGTTANVVVTRSGSAKMVVGALDLAGVSQSAMLTTTGASGKSRVASVTRPSVQNGQMVIDAIAMKSVPSPSLTVGGGQTLRWSQNQSSNGTGAQSTKTHSGATGSVTVSYDKGSGNENEWAMLATTVTTPPPPSISVAKSTTSTFTAAGGSLTYGFTVTNTGSVAVSNVSLIDPLVSSTPIAGCAAVTLAPAATTTCSGTYTTTQADVDAGQVVNTAVATSTETGAVSSNTVTVPFSGTATKTLSVTASTASTFTAVGQLLNYSFTVQNTGSLTLTNITLSDPLVSGTPIAGCAAATLAPGATTTCSGSYTTTQADVDARQVVNTATGSSAETGAVVSNTVTVPFSGKVVEWLTAVTSSTSTFTAAGVTLAYDFSVENTGNVTLTDISLTDALVSSSPIPACAAATLAPGAKTTCSGSYTTTQADVDAGQVVNTATATSTETGGVSSNVLTLSFAGTVARTLAVTKTTSSTFTDLGQVLTFAFTVTNTGNVTLTDISLSDALVSSSPIPACAAATLAPGAKTTCSGSYTTTQGDVDAGQIVNTAVASSTETGDVPSNTVTLLFGGTVGPSLTVVKSSTSSFTAAGVTLAYDFSVENSGNITLANVSLRDPLVSDAPIAACAAATLAPGAKTTCSGSYTTTQADVDAGQVVNTAVATSTETGDVASNTVTLLFGGTAAPSLTVVKSSTSNFTAAGVTLAYDFSVENTGIFTLEKVSLSDPLISSEPIDGCLAASLAPGDKLSCSGTYTTTDADAANGGVTNTATAWSVQTGAVTSNTVTLPYTPAPVPSLTMVKSSASTFTAAGGELVFEYVLENTGTVTLTNLNVSDPLVSGAPLPGCAVAALPGGAKATCSASYTTTQVDVDAGQVSGDARGVSTETGSVTSNVLTIPFSGPVARSLTVLLGSTATFTGTDTPVAYDVTVENAGSITLTGVHVRSPLWSSPLAECAAASLAPGAKVSCSASYAPTQADVEAGQIANQVTAESAETGAVTSDIVVLLLAAAPAAPIEIRSLAVSVSSTSTATVGGVTVVYEYILENTGNVPLTDVALTTSLSATPIAGCATPSLAPGAKVTCSATYTTTAMDLHAGRVEHTATATSEETGPVTSNTVVVAVNIDEQLVKERVAEATKAFMLNRLNGILMSEPESNRLINRGRTGAGRGPMALTGQGDENRLNLAWGTSLQRIRQSAARYTRTDEQAGANRLDTLGAAGARFDVWAEGTYYRHKRTVGGGPQRGEVGLAYTGVDYLLGEHVLVGMLTQFDWSSATASGTGTLEREAAEGVGWMAGPYVSARLAGGILVDVRGAWGRSQNDVSTEVAGLDFDSTFSTRRRLVRATVSGETALDALRIRPTASVAYVRDAQHDYVARNSRGSVHMAGQSIALGRVMAGPELSYRLTRRGGGQIEPFFMPTLIWDAQHEDATAFHLRTRSAETRRGALETGVRFLLKRSISGDATVGIDGFGEPGFSATSVSARFVIPF